MILASILSFSGLSCFHTRLPWHELSGYTFYFLIHRDKWIESNLFKIFCQTKKQTNSFECEASLFEKSISLFKTTICPIDREDEFHRLIFELLSDCILVFTSKWLREAEYLKEEVICSLIYREEIIGCHSKSWEGKDKNPHKADISSQKSESKSQREQKSRIGTYPKEATRHKAFWRLHTPESELPWWKRHSYGALTALPSPPRQE